jgi:hypothetical protein
MGCWDETHKDQYLGRLGMLLLCGIFLDLHLDLQSLQTLNFCSNGRCDLIQDRSMFKQKAYKWLPT